MKSKVRSESCKYSLKGLCFLFILMNVLASCSSNQKSSEPTGYNPSNLGIKEVSKESRIDSTTYNTNYNNNNNNEEDEDALISEQNDLYERANGTKDVEACNDRTGKCYDVEAEVSDGEVEQINFANGGHLDLDGASIDDQGEANGDSYTESEGSDGDSWSISCDDC